MEVDRPSPLAWGLPGLNQFRSDAKAKVQRLIRGCNSHRLHYLAGSTGPCERTRPAARSLTYPPRDMWVAYRWWGS